jgi:hypothetical protein
MKKLEISQLVKVEGGGCAGAAAGCGAGALGLFGFGPIVMAGFAVGCVAFACR